jgi:outer membrane biosynthesis protein TonB
MERNPNKIKALIVSIVLHLAALLMFFYVRLNDVPQEQEFGGISVAFVDEISNQPELSQEVVQSAVQPTSAKETETTSEEEKMLLAEQKTIDLAKKKKEEEERKKKEKQKRLNNILNSLDDSTTVAETEVKNISPDKLDVKSSVNAHSGDFNKTKAFAKNGKGKSTGFFLGDRRPLKQSRPPYKCEGSAVVVVEIVVSPNGKTLFVRAGVEGSNYPSDCFRKEAAKAAKETSWTPNPKAKNNERGYVVYHFKTI